MYLASWALARPPVGSKIKEPHTFAYRACLQESGICGLSVYTESLQKRGCCYFQGDIVSVSAAALLSKGGFGGSEALKKQIQSGVLPLSNHCQLFSSGLYVFFFCKAAD